MDLSHPWTTWPHICNELPFTSREFVGVGDNGDPLPLGGGGEVEGRSRMKERKRWRPESDYASCTRREKRGGEEREPRFDVAWNIIPTLRRKYQSHRRDRRSTVERLGWTSFLVETFFYRNDPFRIGIYILNAKIVFQDYYITLTFIYCHIQ